MKVASVLVSVSKIGIAAFTSEMLVEPLRFTTNLQITTIVVTSQLTAFLEFIFQL